MIIGIDFGTTYSIPAVIDNGKYQELLDHGVYGIPSLFCYSDAVLVGKDAEEVGADRNLIRDIKMKLFADDGTGDKKYLNLLESGGKTFTSEDIVSYIFMKIKETANNIIPLKMRLSNQEVKGAVISVPARFTHNEKDIIRRAAEKANIRVAGLIKEPVAAAIAFFEAKSLPDGTNVLVYDLGGGTCDIAVVQSRRKSNEKYAVIVSDMIRVGGRMWDDALISYITLKLSEKTGIRNLDESLKHVIRNEAIRVKHNLSYPMHDEMSVRTQKARVNILGKDEVVEITLEEFDRVTKHLLDETLALLSKVARDPMTRNIQYVVCVGGGSNMHQVKRAMKAHVRNLFPNASEVNHYEPELAIAYGTAIYADQLTNKSFVKDISPFSYGTEVTLDFGTPMERKMVVNLINKGDPLPAHRSTTTHSVDAGRDTSTFEIFESDIIDEIRLGFERRYGNKVCDIVISHPQVEEYERAETLITMTLDTSDHLEFTATDAKSGNSASVEIIPNY